MPVKSLFFALVALLILQAPPSPAQPPTAHVLMIGIDGLRPDAMATATTPHVDELIASGAFAHDALILGTRYRENNTISGPGWSSLLTGVWADKHGVHDNSFEGRKYEKFPHLFSRIKTQFPTARTASFVNWEPIDEFLVSHADHQKVYAPQEGEDYSNFDAELANDASAYLAENDPHATMVYFGNVDVTGHRDGFHPSVKPYLEAIEVVDGYVGQLMSALRSRPKYVAENWLVLLSSDHGGRGTSHSDGHEVPEILHTVLLVSGAAAKQGALEQQAFIVDLPVTALTHLGVEIDPAWELDGKAVGLK